LEVRYHAAADSDTKVSLYTFSCLYLGNDIQQDEKPFSYFFGEANFVKMQNRTDYFFFKTFKRV
jgi:hypothetical protein